MALFHAAKRAVSTQQFIYELDNVCRTKGIPPRFDRIERSVSEHGFDKIADLTPSDLPI